MKKITVIGSLLMLFTVALTSFRALPADPKKVAVLEFHNYAGLTDYEMERVSDVVRKAALVALPSDLYLIMTRENIFDLLPTGRKLSDCEGECEVETGRLIGADYIVIGSVGYFGGRLEVSMKLYSTASGALLDQGARETDDVSILKARVQDVARQVFKKLPIQSVSVKEEGSKRKGMTSAASSPKGDFGWLTVVSDPPGLKVMVNGRAMGRTPLESRELAPGTYDVMVTDPRYYDEKVSVDVECTHHRTVKLTSSPREEAIQSPGPKKMSRGRVIIGILGIEMVEVPAGKFMMGSSGSGEARGQGEWPVHEVVITRPFLVARYEVTQGIWEEVMGENPSAFIGCGPDCPVESVSWNRAVEFYNTLSEREGLRPAYRIKGDQVRWDRNADGYRLPTEAEWEYACRAGTVTRFNTGDTDADLGWAAWYKHNTKRKTRPVGQKAANSLGLYDMHGNVWEWCWDRYGPYPSIAVKDPAGPTSSGSARVYRGGAWNCITRFCRSTQRNSRHPTFRENYLGLRLFRSLP